MLFKFKQSAIYVNLTYQVEYYTYSTIKHILLQLLISSIEFYKKTVFWLKQDFESTKYHFLKIHSNQYKHKISRVKIMFLIQLNINLSCQTLDVISSYSNNLTEDSVIHNIQEKTESNFGLFLSYIIKIIKIRNQWLY